MSRVTLPQLGEGIEKAVIACWHVKVGEQVTAEDTILDVVTDKATFSVPAPGNGMVQKILVAEGKEIRIGDILAILR